ncbi:MAG: UvrD-helicase domain-containing protein [Pirellulales bacterium]|nr:UvrD-helicase domain-containing protein [Pirellulales bacterium]
MSEPFDNTVIRASAGTGKTFQLSNRFLALALADEPLDAILATTFTRKAAGEILDRVLLRLAEAALDEAKCAELAVFANQPGLTREQCLDLLNKMLRQLHRLRVGTLDRFFIQIARSFGLELGLPPAWQIAEEYDDRRLRTEAIRDVLQGQSTEDTLRLMHLLSKGEVARSVSAQLGSLVTDLYHVFVESPPAAWDALPRPKAPSPEEVQAALDTLPSLPLPSDKRIEKARADDLERFAAEQWEAFLEKGLAGKIANDDPVYYTKPLSDAVQEAYRPLIAHAKAQIIGRIANQTVATGELLTRFDEAYTRWKLAARSLRFDEVTRRLAGNWMDDRLDQVAYRLDAHLRHLLLDEFQDTSPIQWHVLRPIARRVVDGTRRRSFFCVGDVKQAIYGWRGGMAEIFEAIDREMPGLAAGRLDQSFRSSPVVIDTVNRVFENLASNPVLARHPEAAARFAERFSTHTTARTELGGFCGLLTAPAAEDGQKQADVTLADAAERIAWWYKNAPGRSIGVLVRKNQTVARLIHLLRAANIPASEEGGNPLTDSPAVELLLSVLRLADHPGDTTARFHVAHSPLAETLGPARHDDAEAAVRVARDLRERLMNDGYGPTLHDWTRRLASECDARELGRLVQLVELAYGYDARATTRADDFVRLVEQQKVEDPSSADVRVMTFHQAKGLQFDVVVLPELDVKLLGQSPRLVVGRSEPTGPIQRVCRYVGLKSRSLLPSAFAAMFDDNQRQRVEESLCVLYVAVTRAVHALEMIIAPSAANERSLPTTWAGILRAALASPDPTEPETALFTAGDLDWIGSKKQEAEVTSKVALASRQCPHRQDARATQAEATQVEAEPVGLQLVQRATRRRDLDRRSPSQLEGGRKVDLADRFRETSEAQLRGTLLHAWFETIGWLEDGLPDEATLRAVAARVAPGVGDLGPHLAFFHEALAKPVVAETLRRESYTSGQLGPHTPAAEFNPQSGQPHLEVHCERRFAVRDEDALLTGTIDRLVVLFDGPTPAAADVIDFKTDAVSLSNPAALDARIEIYRPQLAAYRRAVAAMYGLGPDRISARLVFLEPGLVRGM